jgi:hypothetical protein
MKLLLKKAARINHKAGEIVEVSPDQARFLLSLNVAEIVEVAEKPAPKRETRSKK